MKKRFQYSPPGVAKGSARDSYETSASCGSKDLQRGTALLATLLALALVAYLGRQLLNNALGYSRLVQSANAGLLEQNKTRLSIASLSTTERGCKRHEFGSQTLSVCSLGAAPFITKPPISLPSARIDYNALFEPPDPCPGARIVNGNRIFTTPQASDNCLLPEEIASSLKVAENIVIESTTVLTSSSTQLITISTPGSLSVKGVVRLSHPTLIVAGGDISIASIVNTNSNKAISVTVISSSGAIKINSLTPSIGLLCLGRSAIMVPQSQTSTEFPLPPFIDAPFAGIAPAS